MKKTIKIISLITLSLISLLAFSALNTYFPNNILSKILRALALVITPVLIALVIMYLINPFTKMLVEKYKFKRKIAISFTIVMFLLITIALFSFISVFLIDQGLLLYENLTNPNFLENVSNWFDMYKIGWIYDLIETYIGEFDITNYFGSINSIIVSILQGLATIILVPIFLYHFMNLQESVEAGLKDNIPSKWHEKVLPLISDSNDVVAQYFRSKVISMVFLFFLFVLTYAFLGIPIGYIILFSFLIAILDLIPYVGPTVGLAIPIIYIFSAGGSKLFYLNNFEFNAIVINILLISINVLIQFVQGNIIIPALSGKEMNINSALILVFMLFFGYILGVWGIVLSIPLGGIILVFWQEFKQSKYFKVE